jgi:hypothetical protein
MARRPRLFAPGLLYHFIVRENQRQKTFVMDRDYRSVKSTRSGLLILVFPFGRRAGTGSPVADQPMVSCPRPTASGIPMPFSRM